MVRLELIELLLEMINRHVHPRIPSQGSVGASGDLAPLAHLALVLQGEGKALVQDQWMDGAEALAKVGLRPTRLQAKEGLALINGTQMMTAIGAMSLMEAKEIARCADIAGAMSLEALKESNQLQVRQDINYSFSETASFRFFLGKKKPVYK